MIANEPDKKRRWNQSAQDERENVATNLRIAGHKETYEHNAKCHERVEMKERHRGIKRELNPKRQRPRLSILTGTKIFFAPIPELDQAGENRVKKVAHSNKKRYEN